MSHLIVVQCVFVIECKFYYGSEVAQSITRFCYKFFGMLLSSSFVFNRKKMDNFCPNADWKRDSNNYVAKRYKEDCNQENKQGQPVSRETYFEDIKLQMDAKLWGEEYNRHNPPKKVDIFMTTVYEMNERIDNNGNPEV